MNEDFPCGVPFVLKILVACIAVQTIMLAYTVNRNAERRGTTVVISMSREGGPERGASCPQPRNPMVSLKINPELLNEKAT